MLLGGYLPKKMKLRCRGIIKLCFICMSVCLLFAPAFLINCPNQPLTGLDTPYVKERLGTLKGSMYAKKRSVSFNQR